MDRPHKKRNKEIRKRICRNLHYREFIWRQHSAYSGKLLKKDKGNNYPRHTNPLCSRKNQQVHFASNFKKNKTLPKESVQSRRNRVAYAKEMQFVSFGSYSERSAICPRN